MLELILLLICYSALLDASHVAHGAPPVLVEVQACLYTKPYEADKLGKIKISWCCLALDGLFFIHFSGLLFIHFNAGYSFH